MKYPSGTVALESLFDDLVEEAFSMGVELELNADNAEYEGVVWLSSIERTTGQKGSGSTVLSMLIDIAHENDLTIKGQIENNNDKLADYYRNNGFFVEYHSNRTTITQIV